MALQTKMTFIHRSYDRYSIFEILDFVLQTSFIFSINNTIVQTIKKYHQMNFSVIFKQ